MQAHRRDLPASTPVPLRRYLHYTNQVVFTLEPRPDQIVFFAKKPGFDTEVEERRFSFFLYEKQEKAQYVEEYAKLLYDAVRGDQTLFVSTREVDAGWRFIDPVIEGWAEDVVPLERYEPDLGNRRGRGCGTRREDRAGGVGVCGLGKMGAGLARNLLDHGWRVVGWNRRRAQAMATEGLWPAETVAELVTRLTPPRAVWLMVPAGGPVDDLVDELADLLAPGDTVIDGGNSHFRDAPAQLSVSPSPVSISWTAGRVEVHRARAAEPA